MRAARDKTDKSGARATSGVSTGNTGMEVLVPRVGQSLIELQRRAGYVSVPEAALLSGFCERTIRTWTRRKPPALKVRRVGPMLVFVEVASLMRATGTAGPQQTDAEILAELAAAPKPNGTHRATPAKPVREITLHRDEDGQ